MAHSCPECSQACYCGGDIDVVVDDELRAEEICTHCPGEDGSDGDDDYEEAA